MEPIDFNIESELKPIDNDPINMLDEFTQKIDDESNLSQYQKETRDAQKNAWKNQQNSKTTESTESIDQLSQRHKEYISQSKNTTNLLKGEDGIAMPDTNTIESTGTDHLKQLFGG